MQLAAAASLYLSGIAVNTCGTLACLTALADSSPRVRAVGLLRVQVQPATGDGQQATKSTIRHSSTRPPAPQPASITPPHRHTDKI